MSSPTLVNNDNDNDQDSMEQRHHHLLLLQHFDPTMMIPPPKETFLCRVKSHLRDAMVRRKHKRHLKQQWMNLSHPIPYPPFTCFFPPPSLPPPPPPLGLSPPPCIPFMDAFPMMAPPEPIIIHHCCCCNDTLSPPINQVYNDNHHLLPGFEKEEQRQVHSS